MLEVYQNTVFYGNGNGEVSLSEYNDLCLEFKSKNWSVKKETIKYLELDLLSLVEILLKFSKIVYEEYGLNITKLKQFLL